MGALMPEPTLEDILAGAEARMSDDDQSIEDILAGAEQRLQEAPPGPGPDVPAPMPTPGDAPPSARETAMTEGLNALLARTAPHLGGASGAAVDWVQDKVGPGMVSDWLQRQQDESLGPERARALEGQGYSAYRDATRERMAEGTAANPGAATLGRVGGVAASIPYLASGGLGAQAAKAGAYGATSGAADTDGDLGEAAGRGLASAATVGALGGLGKLMQARRAAPQAGQMELFPKAATPARDAVREFAGAAKKEGPRMAATALAAGAASQIPVVGPSLASSIGAVGATLGARNLGPLAMKAGWETAKAAGRGAGRAVTSPVTSAAVTAVGNKIRGEETSPSPEALAAVRKMASQRMQTRQVDGLRAAFVGGQLSPGLRQAVGPAIESGSAGDIAAAMEGAQQNPELARELRSLQEAKR